MREWLEVKKEAQMNRHWNRIEEILEKARRAAVIAVVGRHNAHR